MSESHVLALQSTSEILKNKFDSALVRHDAWFVVFVAVIIGLGATLLAGMALWCVAYQHGKFTGHWKWVKYGVSVSMECVR
ncbi:hypothetical protein [Cutibacterium sp.]|uniref:hypothetical protein n=1 Tax=Cutibacterium sp. TaxID=1912221 RepID=UPI0026DB48B2|nr:hypothetical protein [Cutibacterium sp.]MDO4412171.1 hypothetical protein [Cutibacterium sp.]